MIDIDWKPDSKKLRTFGVISLVALGAIGAWINWRNGFLFFDFSPEASRTTAYVLWGLALASGLLSAIAPAALQPVYVGLTVVSFPIGFVVSFLVLAVIYYILLTPIGLYFRLTGRDALGLRLEPDAESYWVKRKPVRDKKRYFRQF